MPIYSITHGITIYIKMWNILSNKIKSKNGSILTKIAHFVIFQLNFYKESKILWLNNLLSY
jgi:hypothetical protein